jgi:hypothetical protein
MPNGTLLIEMKTRLLIISIMITATIISVTFTYFSYQMNVCSSSPEFLHNPQMNSILDCLEFMYAYDPSMPDLRPTLDYDIAFIDLVFLEIILIGSITCIILIFVSRRKRK